MQDGNGGFQTKTWWLSPTMLLIWPSPSVSGTPPREVFRAHAKSGIAAAIKSANSGQAHGESTANNRLFQQKHSGKPRFGDKTENVTAPNP